MKLDPAAVLALDLAAWMLGGVAIGWYHAALPVERLVPHWSFMRIGTAELGGELHRRWFGVHRWKDRVPEAGTWFGGLSKKRLPPADRGGWRRFSAECLRGERVHLSMIGLMVPLAAWNPPRWWAVNVALSVVANVPCIVILRYNRSRVEALTARRAA